jgi:hypothetical protein
MKKVFWAIMFVSLFVIISFATETQRGPILHVTMYSAAGWPNEYSGAIEVQDGASTRVIYIKDNSVNSTRGKNLLAFALAAIQYGSTVTIGYIDETASDGTTRSVVTYIYN